MRLDRPWEVSDIAPAFDAALSQSFAGLRELGYAYSGVTAGKGDTSLTLYGTYSNGGIDRSISVHFSPRRLWVSFASGYRFFTFDEYMKVLGLDQAAKAVALLDANSDIAEQLPPALESLSFNLLKYAKDVVRGESWPDVPIDWAGLR